MNTGMDGRTWKVLALLAALQFVAAPAGAVDRCKVKISGTDGTVLVSATGVSGALMWSSENGGPASAFFDPGCVSGGVATNCTFDTPGTIDAISPPASCTVFLTDGGAPCSARIKKCTPGIRQRDVGDLETRVADLESEVGELGYRADRLEAFAKNDGKRIFVTMATVNGAFGGLAAADALCASEGGPGTWVAWLSTSGTSAASRIPALAGPWFNTNGDFVAFDLADLTDGQLANPIAYNIFGGFQPDYVWTGSGADGSPSSTCTDWSSTGGFGMSGADTSTSAAWTQNGGGAACTLSARLYCLEL